MVGMQRVISFVAELAWTWSNREGIACMNLGLPFLLHFFCFWDTLTTFASHNLFVSYDVLARVAPLKASAFSSAYLGTSGRGHSGG